MNVSLSFLLAILDINENGGMSLVVHTLVLDMFNINHATE